MKRLPAVPGPMKELLRLADQLSDEAIEQIGVVMRREYPSRQTVKALWDWTHDHQMEAGYPLLQKYIAEWARERFGDESTWPSEPGTRSPRQFIRPALEAACLAVTAYALDGISREVMADACRAWHAGLEREEQTA